MKIEPDFLLIGRHENQDQKRERRIAADQEARNVKGKEEGEEEEEDVSIMFLLRHLVMEMLLLTFFSLFFDILIYLLSDRQSIGVGSSS